MLAIPEGVPPADAIKVKSPAWAWECPSGSFWDGYSPDGAGGSCWHVLPTFRAGRLPPVWECNACASSLNETTRATFLTFNGCPKPDPATMSLPGKRAPGNAFLDAAAVDRRRLLCLPHHRRDRELPDHRPQRQAYLRQRFQHRLHDQDEMAAAPFYEPGLAYMQGVKDLIWEQKLFDGTRITGFLYDMAEAQGLGDATPDAKEWVTARWQEIARSPYNSDQFRSLHVRSSENSAQKESRRIERRRRKS